MQKNEKELQSIEMIESSNEVFDNDAENIDRKIQIYTRNYEITINDIITQMEDGDFNIPDYQRNFVWTKASSGRLIESILLGLPIPAIFLSTNHKTQKIDIIDGLQRITSIFEFVRPNWFGEKSNFKKSLTVSTNIDEWKNKKFDELSELDQKRILRYRIPAVDIDFGSANPATIRKIFERINTSGTKLSKQQIRKTVYWDHKLIQELYSKDAKFENNLKISERAKKMDAAQELILRIVAMTWFKNNNTFKEEVKKSTSIAELIDIFLANDKRFDFESQAGLMINTYFWLVDKSSLAINEATGQSRNNILFLEAFCMAVLYKFAEHNPRKSILEEWEFFPLSIKIKEAYDFIYNSNTKTDEWKTSTSSIVKLEERIKQVSGIIFDGIQG